MNLNINKQNLDALCEENAVSYLALFRSHARGEEDLSSDIDLLVKFDKNISLFGLVEAENSFSNFFGRPWIW